MGSIFDKAGIFFFTITLRVALGPPVHWIPGVKCLEHKSDYSPQSSVEVKNAWCFTFASPYILMVWCLSTETTLYIYYKSFDLSSCTLLLFSSVHYFHHCRAHKPSLHSKWWDRLLDQLIVFKLPASHQLHQKSKEMDTAENYISTVRECPGIVVLKNHSFCNKRDLFLWMILISYTHSFKSG
jgi:hypothetical protein